MFTISYWLMANLCLDLSGILWQQQAASFAAAAAAAVLPSTVSAEGSRAAVAAAVGLNGPAPRQ